MFQDLGEFVVERVGVFHHDEVTHIGHNPQLNAVRAERGFIVWFEVGIDGKHRSSDFGQGFQQRRFVVYLGDEYIPVSRACVAGREVIMAERHLTAQRRAAASPAAVWAVFADFPNLADHWDGLKGSRLVGDQRQGVGARREVDLAPVGSMVETVTVWEEGCTLITTNQPSRLVPLKQAEARLTLEPAGDGTAMTFDYRYVPKGGPMGRLIGPVIDRMLRTNFESMLAAVEEAASTG